MVPLARSILNVANGIYYFTNENKMKCIYALLFFMASTVTAAEKNSLCPLDEVALDAQEIIALNSILREALAKPTANSNVTLHEIIVQTHSNINVLPTQYKTLFKRNTKEYANSILKMVCDTEEFETHYYQALSEQNEETWNIFQDALCQVTIQSLALADKLDTVPTSNPLVFLSTHMSDKDLKVKSSPWVLPGLLVMMYGKKIQRTNTKH